jgi:DNA-binding transcriptional LysR family regulator
MELRHLRYFVAVAEEENVTRASVRLRVAQPSLSRQVRDLEEMLGLTLFERNSKSVRLTAAGKAFLGEARGVLLRMEDALRMARTMAGGPRSVWPLIRPILRRRRARSDWSTWRASVSWVTPVPGIRNITHG